MFLEVCLQLSLLQVLEFPICLSDLLSREVCCLLGTRLWDFIERLKRFVQPSCYPLLLLFHVGTNSTAREGLMGVKSDYMALSARTGLR